MSTDIDVSLFKYLVQGVKDYAIFALDPAGTIVSWNPGAERAKGYKEAEIVGKHFSIFYLPESIASKHPQRELEAALRDGSYEEEGWRLRKNGQRFWANVTITALYDEHGTHIGFAKITRDLTERRAAEKLAEASVENLRQTEEVFNLLVSAVKDYAIFIMDPKGHIRTWNSGAQRIKGYLPKEIIGKHFSTFYTEEAIAIKHPDFELREAIAKGSYEEEGWRLRKDGTQFWASITITTIFQDDKVAGFVKVTRDLTERKNYELALEAARDEAILANQLKSKFVASITHEIRTPLTGIVGLSELISKDEACSEDIRETGSRIFEAAKQLLVILNDLLDFSKLEAGKMSSETVPFDVRDVVDRVRGLCEAKATTKSLNLRVDISENVPKMVVGDPTKIRQVLLNLVDNAVKFTESGGVEIAVEKSDDDILYSVTDTGIGIEEELQKNLFQPFVQAEQSTTRLYGGSGLGLSIAHQIVSLLGGKIGMASQPGNGTTVWFTLPVKEELSHE